MHRILVSKLDYYFNILPLNNLHNIVRNRDIFYYNLRAMSCNVTTLTDKTTQKKHIKGYDQLTIVLSFVMNLLLI